MRGIILIPKLFDNRTYVTDRYACLFNKIKDELGFKISISDNSKNIDSGVEVIITFKSPQHSNPNTMMELVNLNRNVKLVGYFSDLHSYENKIYEDNMSQMLDRCDIILCPYDEAFRKKWPQYLNKYVFFPHFFAPYERYVKFRFNERPIPKCLLSGSMNPSFIYPLRTFIREKGDLSTIDVLQHPGYHRNWKRVLKSMLVDNSIYVGKRYAGLMNRYFCSIATSSIFHYVVAKYFEIPATGTLLLANEVEDLEKLGFIPFKHYVPITKDDVLSQIDDCLANQKKYREIRKTGMEFVRENHSINNRFKQFKKILKDVL
ncbi:hypothetical protein ES703_81277 [subsurface metagenome]